jgi:hypothetical protein
VSVVSGAHDQGPQPVPRYLDRLNGRDRLLRWVLVLAATQAVRRPGPLRTWFHAVKKRRGWNLARVALARRLAEIVYHVWKQECDYFTVIHHGVVRG